MFACLYNVADLYDAYMYIHEDEGEEKPILGVGCYESFDG